MSLRADIPPMQLLEAFGPESPARPEVSEQEALAYVRDLARGHYENFSVLSSLVPRDLVDDFAAVYAFCRWADDLGDETGRDEQARERSLRLLAWWREELQQCFLGVQNAECKVQSDTPAARANEGGGQDALGAPDHPPAPAPDTLHSALCTLHSCPPHPVFTALKPTILRRNLQVEPFDLLIQAFEQDQRLRHYQTWEEVLGYCRKSADPVGRIVLTMFGHPPPGPDAPATHPDRARHDMSDAICTALQLTNFWQDVRRDLLERDRVYMPSRETGISVETLRQWAQRGDDPAARVPFIRALRPLIEKTWALYEKGKPLPGTLAPQARPVVWLFAAGGRRVLRRVEEIGCATLWKRPKLTRADKFMLIARAFAGAKLAGTRGRAK